MSRILNITLLVLTIAVLLAAIGAAILLATFNPNDYKEKIRAAAEELTGCRVVLHEQLEITFLPRLEMHTGRVSLYSPCTASEEPDLEAADISLSLALKPLLEGILEVREVSAHGGLFRYAGASDRGSLFRCGTKPEPPASASGTGALRFRMTPDRVICRDSRISFSDRNKNELWSLRLDKAELSAPRLDADVPLSFSGALVDSAGGKTDFFLEAVAKLDGQGLLKGKGASLRLRLEGLGDLPILLESQGIFVYDSAEGTIELEKLRGFLQAADAWSTPEKEAAARSEFRGHINMQLPHGNTNGTISGALHADNLDLDILLRGLDPSVRFVEPDGETVKGAPNFTRPKVNRIIGGASGTVAQPDNATSARPREESGIAEPTASFRQGFLNADTALDLALSADTVVLGRMPTANVDIKIRSVGRQTAVPYSFEFFGGAVAGTGRVDFRRKLPAFALACQIRGLHMRRFFEGWGIGCDMGGVGSATLEISGQGSSYNDFLHSMKGKAAFQVLHGEIRDFRLIPDDLPHNLTAPKNFLFRSLSGSADIHAGSATFKDILLESSTLSGRGGGTVHLPYEQLDLGMDFMIQGRPPVIPVTISGPYKALSISVDMPAFLRNVDEAYIGDPHSDEPYRGTGEILLDEDGTLHPR